MNISPYQLCGTENSSDTFYAKLHDFSLQTYNSWFPLFSDELHHYAEYLTARGERFRSYEEYTIEFLTLTMTWKEYLGGSQKTPRLIVRLMKRLYLMRSISPLLKRATDSVRGVISGIFLYPTSKTGPTEETLSLSNLHRLIEWLACSGEFTDEVKRFYLWYDFLTLKGETYFSSLMKRSVQQFEHFIHDAEEALGAYTCRVAHFHETLGAKERWREDALFRRKGAVEYHINMIASEIINMGLKEMFLKTPQRLVLLPACMSTLHEKGCRKHDDGTNISCTSCTPNCHIRHLTELGKKHNFGVSIVPHSSSFTKWLQRWENTTEFGIVAVACPLNIVVGGYQMRALNIPSQCVLLDFSGCAKHWGPDSAATTVNFKRLLKVVKEGV